MTAAGQLTKHFETRASAAPVIRTSIVGLLVSRLAALGIDTKQLLQLHGIDAGLLDQRYAVIELWRYVALFESASRLTRNDQLGFELGQACRPEQIGPLGLLFVLLPTLREALRAFGNLLSAVQSESSMRLTVSLDEAACSYRINDAAIWPRRQDTEFTFAILLTLFRARLGQRWSPYQVAFEHAPSVGNEIIRRKFGCPVLYEQPLNRLLFDAADLDAVIPDVNVALIDVIKQHLLDLIGEEGPKRSFIDHASLATTGCMAEGRACLDCVAKRLGLTGRTLQRNLRANGWTFRALLDRCRLEMAQTLQTGNQLSREAVAQRLGYADGTTLSRSKRRWNRSARA